MYLITSNIDKTSTYTFIKITLYILLFYTGSNSRLFLVSSSSEVWENHSYRNHRVIRIVPPQSSFFSDGSSK